MPQPAVARAPDGVRLYAVGDVHGRVDLLDRLIGLIEADHAARPPARVEIILLGDYIDRGHESAAVMDRLCAGPPAWARWTLLRGNHEQIVLDIFDEPMRVARDERIVDWLRFGGGATLRSYGAPEGAVTGKDPWAAADALQARMPPAHRALMRAMPLAARRGDYLLVHAGIRPGLPLDAQADDDLLWIRQPFLDSAENHGAVVVHGHSISLAAELKPNRIGVDTGAYATGVLTAVALEGAERRLIQTG